VLPCVYVFVADEFCVWATILRKCLPLRCGTQLADVRTCLPLRTCLAFALWMCVGAPNLRTCLALRLGAQLADVPCVAFMRPFCGHALHCIGVPNLGEAVLKSLPPRQNFFLSILQLIFKPSAPFCGCFRCGWAPNLWTCRRALRCGRALHLRCGRALGHPTCGRALRCVGAPNLRTCLVLHLGVHLADVRCVALGRPTLVRPY
jgi:hypothetical protein